MGSEKILPLEYFRLSIKGAIPSIFVEQKLAPYEEEEVNKDEFKVNVVELAKSLNSSNNCKSNNIVPNPFHKTAVLKKPNLPDKTTFSNKKWFSCKFCMKDFRKLRDLIEHAAIHVNKTPLKCDLCDFRCTDENELLEHTNRHQHSEVVGCELCEFRCLDAKALEEHSKVHAAKVLHCEQCNYKCQNRSHLQRHIRVHTGEKPFKCNLCDYKANQRSSVLSHMLTHKNENTLKCSLCRLSFTKRKDLRLHVKIHIKDNIYLCHFCNFQYFNQSDLDDHLKSHNSSILKVESKADERFKCNICEVNFANLKDLIKHKLVHNGVKCVCTICNKKFHNEDMYHNHLRVEHKTTKPFECTICKLRFKLSGNLQRHLKKHEDSLKCEKCNFRCKTASRLKNHMANHKEVKKKVYLYLCGHCKGTFKEHSIFQQHVKECLPVESQFPFQCSVCEKQFMVKVALRRHMLLHKPEKRFKCHICPYQGHRKDNFVTHLQTHMRKMNGVIQV